MMGARFKSILIEMRNGIIYSFDDCVVEIDDYVIRIIEGDKWCTLFKQEDVRRILKVRI